MDFNELLEQLRNPGEDGLPETIYDDVAEAYNHAIETRDAKINEIEALRQAQEAEISRLKSVNYDLMMSSAANDGGDNEDSESESDSDTDDDITIDDLFED